MVINTIPTRRHRDMEPAEYLAWLDGREDSEELRSEWALSKQIEPPFGRRFYLHTTCCRAPSELD